MARIGWIEESEATGELADAYAEIRASWPPKEQAAEVFKALSHRPDFMRALSDATLMTITPGALTSTQHEMIALYVSALTSCRYCAYHHKVFLQVGALRTAPLPESEQQEEAQQRNLIAEALYRRDLDGAPVSQSEHLLLRFVEAMTLQPGEVPDIQIHELRDAGWSEAQIAEAVYTCALYNAWVRITNAFDTNPHDIDATFGLTKT
ncbi:MAG: carboxymuconolactone decarboxylase family protein [Pseudomonas sp.]